METLKELEDYIDEVKQSLDEYKPGDGFKKLELYYRLTDRRDDIVIIINEIKNLLFNNIKNN